MSSETVLKGGPSFLRHAARLNIQPRPLNLGERRRIYQHLQKYGDILFFKSLYYDRTVHAPDSALLIFRHHESLQRLQQESPITVKLTRRAFDPTSLHWPHMKFDERTSPLDLNPRISRSDEKDPARRTLPVSVRKLKFDLNTVDAFGNEYDTTVSDEEAEEADSEVEFQIWAHYWQDSHRSLLELQPFWGPFTMKGSMLQRDLEGHVPIPALSDTNVFRKAAPKPVRNRQRQRTASQKTLRQIYEEGLATEYSEKGPTPD